MSSPIGVPAHVFAVLGSSLNVALSALLSAESMSQTLAAFRICLHISALHGFLMSQTFLVTQITHLYYDGCFIIVAFPPFNIMVPAEWARDVWFVVGFALNTAMWQLTPAPCILQYLLLSNGLKSRRRLNSVTSIIFISYAPSIVMMLLAAIWATDFLPTPKFERKMNAAARHFYNLTQTERIIVYGLSFERDSRNNGRSLYSLGCVAVVLTYVVTYSLFFAVFRRVQQLLQQSTMSNRTMQLQRRFVQLQLFQGLAPLVIMAIPLSVFALCFIFQLDTIGYYSLVQSIGFYIMPSLQSAVYIYFVKYASRGSRNKQNTAPQNNRNNTNLGPSSARL